MTIILCGNCVAETSIEGLWAKKGQDNPWHTYEFLDSGDFKRTYITRGKDATKTISVGVWEFGNWDVTTHRSVKIVKECTLTIYLHEEQCCFKHKFVSDNLILTAMYNSRKKKDSFGGLCRNKILTKYRKEW